MTFSNNKLLSGIAKEKTFFNNDREENFRKYK